MTAVGYTAGGLVTTDDIGEIGGPAGPLDEDGFVPAEQLPASAGGGPDPATTVVAQTTPGAGSAVGTGGAYARDDHAHGTPALPTPAAIGAATSGHNHSGTYDPAGTASSAVNAHAGVTTSVHGIANTAALETTTGATAKVTAHTGATDPHGDRAYADTAAAGRARAVTYSTPLAGPWTNATTTLGDVTGLSLAVPAAGTYEFDFWVVWSGDQGGGTSTATAPRWQLTGPTSSHLEYSIEVQTANATTNSFRRNAMSSPAAPTTGAQTAGSTYMTRLRGRIVATAAGTLQPQASLATGTATGTVSVLSGSYGRLQQAA